MGRPTPTHMQKKLIRSYFKFGLKRQDFNTSDEHFGGLQAAWSKYGMDSPQAGVALDKIDAAFIQDEKEYKDMKKLVKNLPYKLNQSLPKIKPKILYKGRHRRMAAFERDVTRSEMEIIEKMNNKML